jgi:hypothetical protein
MLNVKGDNNMSNRTVRIASIANQLYIQDVENLREAGLGTLLKKGLNSIRGLFDPAGAEYESLSILAEESLDKVKEIAETLVKTGYRHPVAKRYSPSQLGQLDMNDVNKTFSTVIEGVNNLIKSNQDKVQKFMDKAKVTSDKEQSQKINTRIKVFNRDIQDLKNANKNLTSLRNDINGMSNRARRAIMDYKASKNQLIQEDVIEKDIGKIFGIVLQELLDTVIMNQKDYKIKKVNYGRTGSVEVAFEEGTTEPLDGDDADTEGTTEQ